jgi:CubicO group peptidase (beta-lactamase class C family)
MVERKLAPLLWIFACCFDLAPAHAEGRFTGLEATLREELQAKVIPGAAVAVVEGDRVTFVAAQGVLNVETREPVKPESLFRLGSTTKMFTATAVVLLSEQKKLRLDAPIGQVASGLSPRIAALTMDQLLSHRSGLSDEVAANGPHDERALADAVRSWDGRRLFTDPGSIYSYANPGYNLAGYVLQEVSGKPFADQMNDSLFAPLGMRRTTFRPMLALTYSAAAGHSFDVDARPVVVRPLADNMPAWPSGQMFSNVLDLANFTIAFMNDGKLQGVQVLPPSAIKILSSEHARPPTGRFTYGYGLERTMSGGEFVLEHGGSLRGYGSFIRMFPGRKAAVIVLTNVTSGELPKTVEAASQIATGTKAE